MKILLDEQDVMDAIHVAIAARENNGSVEGSEPHLVTEVRMMYEARTGFRAAGFLYGRSHLLEQQDVIDAVVLYLSEYYSFLSNRLLVDLQYDEAAERFSADVDVVR